MKSVKVLENKFNGHITTYVEGHTAYNEDYWELKYIEVEDDFNVDIDDYRQYENKIL